MADAAAPVQAADSAPTEDLQQETVASAQGAGATAAETASGPETTRAASSSGSMLLDQIDKLKAEQVALKATKAKLAKEMKNAVKRKKGCRVEPASCQTTTWWRCCACANTKREQRAWRHRRTPLTMVEALEEPCAETGCVWSSRPFRSRILTLCS